MILVHVHGKDWRCLTTKASALDSPDDSLASLSCLNTLMSFSWSSPVAPETTFILQNDLPLSEQLIASLPETPGFRVRLKKDTVAAGSESRSGEPRCNIVDEKQLDESPQQVCWLLVYSNLYYSLLRFRQ